VFTELLPDNTLIKSVTRLWVDNYILSAIELRNKKCFMGVPLPVLLHDAAPRYRYTIYYFKPYTTLPLLPVAPTSERRASEKRFVSLQFLNPRAVGRTSWTEDQPVAKPLPT
jgi:hypothetical protein